MTGRAKEADLLGPALRVNQRLPAMLSSARCTLVSCVRQRPMRWRAVAVSTRPVACHVIQRILNPRFLISMASYAVASNIWQVQFPPRHVTHIEPSLLESNGIVLVRTKCTLSMRWGRTRQPGSR
jgi:hypothetical protein